MCVCCGFKRRQVEEITLRKGETGREADGERSFVETLPLKV